MTSMNITPGYAVPRVFIRFHPEVCEAAHTFVQDQVISAWWIWWFMPTPFLTVYKMNVVMFQMIYCNHLCIDRVDKVNGRLPVDLIRWGWVTHTCFNELGHHWFEYWLRCKISDKIFTWTKEDALSMAPLEKFSLKFWATLEYFLSSKCIWKCKHKFGDHFG